MILESRRGCNVSLEESRSDHEIYPIMSHDHPQSKREGEERGGELNTKRSRTRRMRSYHSTVGNLG